jgi:hypothetical protein
MHTHRSRFAASALALIAFVALGACSSSSKSSSSSSSTTNSSSSSSSTSGSSSSGGGGDKEAFCQTNSELDAATANASSPADLQKAFKDNSDKLDTILEQAPDEVKADTEKLVTAAKQVAQTGDPSPFQNDPSLAAAGQHLDTFCGTNSSGSSTAVNLRYL